MNNELRKIISKNPGDPFVEVRGNSSIVISVFYLFVGVAVGAFILMLIK